MGNSIDILAVKTIQMLAVDAIEKANSGHPGMPMGAADYTFILWNRFLKYSPANPKWPNRDRFVLSAGHGSMLLYSLLHLAGFDLPMNELQNFRQWGSQTPGHPEYGRTPGVETTTGPLGQGGANAVGMALGARMMGARFNTPDFSPIDHFVYALVSDGDMMEGVNAEAASLAGHLKLGNLIFIYDDNQITIDGSTKITFTENVGKRYEAYGWHVQTIDGHQHAEIDRALKNAQEEKSRPSLIVAKTHIGHGSPNKVDTSKVHGAPLGKDEVIATKKNLNWPLEPTFYVPSEVKDLFQKRTQDLEKQRKGWEENLQTWKKKNPELAKNWDLFWTKDVPKSLYDDLIAQAKTMAADATRSVSGQLQQTVAKAVPMLVGGSADLNESTKTEIKGSPTVTQENFTGRNLAFGIREHAMASIQNGLALYGSWIPFGSTFLVFSDYMKPAIRLAGLSRLQSLYIFTHDSIFLGEDGPTHQAIEHLGMLRMIPNMKVIRPADPLECAAAWKIALDHEKGPTAVSLTRQKIPAIERSPNFNSQEMLKGAYVVLEDQNPEVVLIGTGSELQLAIGAAKELKKDGKKVRVVSMLCMEQFSQQPTSYRESVLPPNTKIAAIEAGHPMSWYRWVGKKGLFIGIDHFGESAPDKILAEKFGFTIPQVTEKIRAWLKN